MTSHIEKLADDDLFGKWARHEAVLALLASNAEVEAIALKHDLETTGLANNHLAAWGRHYLLEEIIESMREHFDNEIQLKEVK